MKTQLKLVTLAALLTVAGLGAKSPTRTHKMKPAASMQDENMLVIVAEGQTPVLVSVERKQFGKNEVIQEATLKMDERRNDNGNSSPSNVMTVALGDLKPYQAVYDQYNRKLIVRLDDTEYKNFLASGRMKWREENRDLAVTLETADQVSPERFVGSDTIRFKINSANVAELIFNADNMTLKIKSKGAVAKTMSAQKMYSPDTMQTQVMPGAQYPAQQPMIEASRPAKNSKKHTRLVQQMEENDEPAELMTAPDALEVE